jgi:hypothetical protein
MAVAKVYAPAALPFAHNYCLQESMLDMVVFAKCVFYRDGRINVIMHGSDQVGGCV